MAARSTSSSLLVVVVVMMVAMVCHKVHCKVDYNCVFGPMMTVTDERNTVHHFCATEMVPPFLQRGQYVQAINTIGTCFECVCEEQVGGLACCETECIL